MKWESILKKEWTEDDYEHPVVKELFRLMKNTQKEGYEGYESQFKALKLFETNCSQYDISLVDIVHFKELRVFLPNNTALFVLFPKSSNYGYTISTEGNVFLKGGECPVCIKSPEGGRLPLFDYIVSMVDLAANHGRGFNIDALDLANKWVEKGITWGGNYELDPRLYTPLSENNHLFEHLILKYHDDLDKLTFIANSLLPYHESVIKKFIKQLEFLTDLKMDQGEVKE